MMKELMKRIKKDLKTCIILSFIILVASICVVIGNDIESAVSVFSFLEIVSIISTMACIIIDINDYIEKDD